jgi:uncharacterized membrane protein YraQ (UPF0718 family)
MEHEHHHGSDNAPACKHCAEVQKYVWYKDNLTLVTLLTVIFFIVGYFTSYLNAYSTAFIEYFGLIWWAVLLGLFLGGAIDYFVPEEFIFNLIGGTKKRTIFIAVFLGFLMSACSHGILAISIELYKKGASIPAVIAFLLASPWANLPVTLLLFSFFGIKALFFVVSAIVIAIITGLILQVLDRKGMLDKHTYQAKIKQGNMKKKVDYGLMPMISGVAKGSWELTRMILWWVMIGMVLAAFTRAYVPSHIFMQYFGPSVFGLLATLVVATIIEVCSEGSSPLAFELYRQTGAFGNVFTFLMAGVVTDYTEIGLIWSNIGRKTAMWMPIISVPQVLILAWLFNQFL